MLGKSAEVILDRAGPPGKDGLDDAGEIEREIPWFRLLEALALVAINLDVAGFMCQVMQKHRKGACGSFRLQSIGLELRAQKLKCELTTSSRAGQFGGALFTWQDIGV